MLEDLIIETEPIDTTNLSEQEKVIIDGIELTKMIKFNLTWNSIGFCDENGYWHHLWFFKNDIFVYSYSYYKIYFILIKKYSYNYQQINDLVREILLNHYKIKVTDVR